MNRNWNILVKNAFASVFALVLLASCSKVYFAGSLATIEDAQKNKASEVTFDVDWSAVGTDIPSEMTVLMSRIQNVTVHYAWRVNNMGEPIGPVTKSPYLFDNTSDAATEGQTDDDQISEDTPEDALAKEPMMVQHGLYTIMAVAAHSPEDFEIERVERFQDSLAYKVKDVYVRIPQVPKDESYIDLNPGYEFLRSIQPLYFVGSDNTLVSSVIEGGIPLTMRKLTRRINFRITLRTETNSRTEGNEEVIDTLETVFLDSLMAVVSGVPIKAQLMSGYVSERSVGKMGFDLKKTGHTRVPGNDEIDHIFQGTYEGSINVFGLFPPADVEKVTGPGIINLFLYPKVYEERNGKLVEYSKLFHSTLNLKNEIEKRNLMSPVPDRSEYILNGTDDVDLVVESDIILSRKDVLSSTNQGLDKWNPNDVEPDEDGDRFNPGLEM